MQLPLEIAMVVGSFLNAHDLRVSTTQLCSKGVEFVARPITDRNAKLRIRWNELISSASSSSTQPAAQRTRAQVVAQEVAKRIDTCLARRANVAKIALCLDFTRTANKRIHAELYRHFQHAVQVVQPNQNQAITVEWHEWGASVTDVAALVELVSATAGAQSSEASMHRRYRLQLMLNLSRTQETDVTALASCQSLHRLDLSESRVTDVSALASCQSLHTLKLVRTRVTDITALASCQSLHRLDLSGSKVTDVSALASSQSLHTLDLAYSTVADVSAFALSESLHWLNLYRTLVTDVSALARCPTLHTLILDETEVSNVAGLAASKSLHTLWLSGSNVRDVSALESCVSLRKVEGAGGMDGYGALQQLLLQRQHVNPTSQ
jgi:hypothetical protein